MESIEELRKICQTTAKKDKSNVYMRYVCRFLSIYFTRLLLPTSVTANQVSFAMIMTGVMAGIFFLSPSKGVFFLGALILQAWYLLDCMDGEVARYRHYKKTGSMIIDKRESSLTGMYYDMVNHYIVNFLVPITIGLGLYHQTHHIFPVYLGILGSLGQVLMLAMHDCKTRAIMAHLKKFSRIEIVPQEAEKGDVPEKHRSFFHSGFMSLHYMMTYPTVMNLVLITSILNLLWPAYEWRFGCLIFISISSIIVVTIIISRIISQALADQEMKAQFKTASDY